MFVAELERRLDEAVPYAWAESWDNVGLLLGNRSDHVQGIAISLDPSLEAMKMAIAQSCSVLIAHHPIFFHPLKRIECSEGNGAQIAFATRHGLSVFALHSNWDVSPDGVNATIARALSLRDAHPLIAPPSGGWGSGAFGTLPRPLPFMEYGAVIRDALHLSRIELHGEPEAPLTLLALCGGSGGGYWRDALACGAGAFFTADMKYHERLDALGAGLSLFLADHGEMERFSLSALAETVSRATEEKTVVLDAPPPAFRVI